MCQTVELGRKQRREDPKMFATATQQNSFDPTHPTQFVFHGLMTLITSENFNFETNDVLDFFHASVALAYCDFVLLDSHWADLARKLKMPGGHTQVYSPKQVDQFLDDFDRFS